MDQTAVSESPDIGGIFRLWSPLGQCLLVSQTLSIRQSLAGWLHNLAPENGSAAHPGPIGEVSVDWSKIDDGFRRRRLKALESERLRPLWRDPKERLRRRFTWATE